MLDNILKVLWSRAKFMQAAKKAASDGNYADAEKYYCHALSKSKTPEELSHVHRELADLYYSIDDYARSVEELDVAIKLVDASKHKHVVGLLHYKRAKCRFMQENYVEAAQDFEKAESFQVKGKEFFSMKAEAYVKIEFWSGARADLTKLIEVYKNDSTYFSRRAFVNLKMAETEQGLYALAFADAKEALQLDENNYEAHAVMGIVLRRLDRLEQAEKHLSKAIKYGTFDKGELYYERFLAYQGLDESESAAKDLEKVRELAPAKDPYLVVN